MLHVSRKNKKSIRLELYIASLFNLIIILFFSVSYLNYVQKVDNWFTNFFIYLNHLGHFFLINSLPLIICLVLSLFLNKFFLKFFFILFSSVALIFIKVDTIVFSQFRYHLSPIVFKLAFGKRAGDIFQFSTKNYVYAILFVIAIILVQFLFLFLANKIIESKRKLYLNFSLLFLILTLVFTNIGYAYFDANVYRPITQLESLYPAYFPLTADGLFMKLNLIDENAQNQKENIELIQKSKNLNYPINPIESNPSKNKKNVLFIVIDSWRYDYLTEKITPNIFHFKDSSLVFNNHYSGSNMTTGGIFSLMYGIPATYYDAFTDVEKGSVLIDELQTQKYNLNILSSSNLENPPFNKNAFASVKDLRLYSNGKTPSERDVDIYNNWTNFINSNNSSSPFYGFVFFDAAHGFDFPNEYKTPFNPYLEEVDYLALDDDYDPKLLINRYKNALHFIDDLVGKIILQLKNKNLLENTVIVITGDHGQEFNDTKKGYWQHGGNFSDYQIKVPFLVYDASKIKVNYNHLTLHYDVVPTIMSDVLGVTSKIEDYSYGKSLYDTRERDCFICGYNQRFALIEKKRIVKVFNSGIYEVVNKNLDLINEEPNPEHILNAMNEMKKFYKLD